MVWQIVHKVDTEKALEVWDKIINLKKDDNLNVFFNILIENE